MLTRVDELMSSAPHPVVLEDVHGEMLNEASELVPDVRQYELLIGVAANAHVKRADEHAERERPEVLVAKL